MGKPALPVPPAIASAEPPSASATPASPALVVAVSSRALFDFEAENQVFERDRTQYQALQRARLDEPAAPGVAFELVRKLLAFNTSERALVEVVLLSRNDPVSGLRIFRSARAHGLRIERGVFTQGRQPFAYLKPLGAHLFLSANEADVVAALAAGQPAARVFPHNAAQAGSHAAELRIAFDGDAVLFSDQAERIYQAQGLAAFVAHETEHVAQPLPDGPFKPLLLALQRLREAADAASGALMPTSDEPRPLPIGLRTALVTARSAPAHERAIRTLMDWNLPVDEAFFLGGAPKGGFLQAWQPDFFFDDYSGHVESAAAHSVPAALVPSPVRSDGLQ